MKKVFRTDIQLQKILELANIESDFIEVTIQNGVAIIQPKRQCCVKCGSSDSGHLISRSGVLLCRECIKSDDIKIVHDGNLDYLGRRDTDASNI